MKIIQTASKNYKLFMKYILITAFLGFAFFIYNVVFQGEPNKWFSHATVSPLIGILTIYFKRNKPAVIIFNIGIAFLTVLCFIFGVYEIKGSEFPLTKPLTIIMLIIFSAGLITAVLGAIFGDKRKIYRE
ncbi:MAG: hypothetical protein LBM87_04270 [Ruminococcus sp.]|jgi:predicted acyltransferase|nr:hypothetical protein [Ruminococcus sp.]